MHSLEKLTIKFYTDFDKFNFFLLNWWFWFNEKKIDFDQLSWEWIASISFFPVSITKKSFNLLILITFPKLPLPKTVKKWKSSTEYFLKRGIEVAGAVIVPDRWNCAYVYDVSIRWNTKRKWFILIFKVEWVTIAVLSKVLVFLTKIDYFS